MSLSPRAELVQLQRRIWRRNKAVIDQSVIVHEPGFVAYERRYRRAVSRFAKVASQDTLLRAVRHADLVYVGDYHTCAQSQRSFLRLLKAMAGGKRKLLIGLELLHRRHQAVIDAFLTGRIREDVFLRRAGLRRHWVFDLWNNFRPIFDFARYHSVPIVGIDAAPAGAWLAARDQATGQYVAELAAQFPEHQLLILIGDLHLAPQHLPRAVQRALRARGRQPRDLILYQNSEAIWWQLAAQGREHRVSQVQINARSFCRMHTPPIVCQQSYLHWLDHEEGEIDYADAKHQFLEVVDQIAGLLRIPPGAHKDDVTVYTCGDLSFLEVLRRRRIFAPKELAIIRRHVLASESYFIPAARMVYLANLSMNHAAEEAAHYLKFLCCGPEQPRTMVDAFYANVLHEALGFFGSKLVNPKRKCHHEPEFRRLLRHFHTQGVPPGRELEYDTAALVLAYKKYERRGKPLQYQLIFHQPPDHFFAVTHALGYMLGDAMFYGMMDHKLRRATIRALWMDPWRRPGSAHAAYMALRRRLRGVKIPQRM